MSKYCTQCGSTLPDTTAFCTKCGAKLGNTAGEPAEEIARETVTQSVENPGFDPFAPAEDLFAPAEFDTEPAAEPAAVCKPAAFAAPEEIFSNAAPAVEAAAAATPVTEAPVAPAAEETPVAAAATPVTEVPVVPAAEKAPVMVARKISGGKKAAIICAALAALVAVIVIILLAGGKKADYEKALANYQALDNGDVDKLEGAAPEEFWELVDDRMGLDIEDVKDALEDGYDDTLEFLEEEYGENAKMLYEVTDKEKLDEGDLKSVAGNLQDRYWIKWELDKGYRLEIRATVESDDGKFVINDGMEIYAVKIESNWYLVSNGGFIVEGYLSQIVY